MITTRNGKRIEIISQADLRDPLDTGLYVRAYCHIHGSDHQRSLSINKSNGWGHCFNASCHATVLVSEWNPRTATLLQRQPAEIAKPPHSSFHIQTAVEKPPESSHPVELIQPPLLLEPKKTPRWQQEELRTLLKLEDDLREEIWRANMVRLYLRERGITAEITQRAGISYLSPAPEKRGRSWRLRRWGGRLLFPLYSPYGRGFIGRTLRYWRPGMDENAHKKLLDRPHRPRRWIKTNPAGWFCVPFEELAEKIILVEGAFDRLTLLEAGFAEDEVVALAGTALQPGWLPPQVKQVILALDGDEGGQEASRKLAEQLLQDGYKVHLCPPPQDGEGKDWNERWRKQGWEGLIPLFSLPVD